MKAELYMLAVAAIVIALGFGVPYTSIKYMVFYGISGWVAVPIAILAIIVAGIVAIIGFPLAVEYAKEAAGAAGDRVLAEKVKAYRARQRAMLEELDEIVALLREMRNTLSLSEAGSHEQ